MQPVIAEEPFGGVVSKNTTSVPKPFQLLGWLSLTGDAPCCAERMKTSCLISNLVIIFNVQNDLKQSPYFVIIFGG